MGNPLCRGWNNLIKTDDPEHEQYINRIDDKSYEVLTDKLPPGESIQCIDDPDMVIIKNDDNTVTLQKKCYKKCFF